ncbi:hypothetical protein [Streptomyces sp. 891-h]|uniref:hypothetical protein n=1 Tax=Streptomyces sp. 891-h TaxID=2720714 RepID=UPI001FA99A74|nr:hypothetical protein [Streptomyces sp. 891-h]UNZ18723.1 hypothetical protein HC362_18460 [Streptomyces sp. 891-h]
MPRNLRRIATLAAGTTLAATSALALAAPAQAATVTPAPGLECETNIQHDIKYASVNCTDVTGAHVWRVHVICGWAPDQYTDWLATGIGSTVGNGARCPAYSSGVGGVEVQVQ